MSTHQPYSHVLLVTGSRSWESEELVYEALGKLWQHWEASGPAPVTKPLLISGRCPQGADAIVERIWAQAGYDAVPMPADWNQYGKKAGVLRNEAMVREALLYRRHGAEVAAIAFLDICGKFPCSQREQEQLMPEHIGHFSHGTVHCRNAAKQAGIPLLDMISPPPF